MQEEKEIRKVGGYETLLTDTQTIIEQAKLQAYTAVNASLVERNWLLGKRIAEEDLLGQNRAEYGAQVIKLLSQDLTSKYGKGFDASNLYKFKQFYQCFPQILDTLRLKSKELLSWSHYRILLQVNDREAMEWYAHEAYTETWGVRTLQRNVSTQYYHRMLQSQKKDLVRQEMLENTAMLQQDKLEYIKSPVIVEFLGLSPDNSFTESELEESIITNIERFLLELGKGFAFVARQQHIHTEKEDYYIDLVFYNYHLKCFILVDLKTTKVTHQDIGQMDMYVRMYDELKRPKGDNPTLGILLCADTDEDIARYSILHDSEQLFATKYKVYLPSEEELRREIEREKMNFYLQKKD